MCFATGNLEPKQLISINQDEVCILHVLLSGLLVKQRDAFHRKLPLRSQDNNHFCSIPATFHEYEHKLSQAKHVFLQLISCRTVVYV